MDGLEAHFEFQARGDGFGVFEGGFRALFEDLLGVLVGGCHDFDVVVDEGDVGGVEGWNMDDMMQWCLDQLDES